MATPIEQRGYAHPDVLVSTDWVEQHLNDPKVRIIESNEDTLLYSSGHVPGAVHVDWTSDLNDQIRRDYITREGFEALMSRIGATPRHHGRLLRRQEQLVGVLCLLGVSAVRPHEREGDGRRAAQVGEGEAARRPATCPTYAKIDLQVEGSGRPSAPRLSRRGARAPEGAGTARRRPQPRGVRRHAPAHARLPERRGAPRRPHPGREERPVGPRHQSRRRNVQDRRRS